VQSAQMFGRAPPQTIPSAGVYTDTITIRGLPGGSGTVPGRSPVAAGRRPGRPDSN